MRAPEYCQCGTEMNELGGHCPRCGVWVPPPDMCVQCRFCFGPIVLLCGNPESEFFKGPVVADGYCDKFAPPIDPPDEGVGLSSLSTKEYWKAMDRRFGRRI
jgi:hypothetical protein